MNKIINLKTASIICKTIYIFLLLFHLIIIIGTGFLNIIPYDIVWGGKMESKEQLIFFEILSFLIIAFCLFLTLIKSRHLKIAKLNKIAHYAMWVFFAYFLLNTFGNILANTIFEKSFAIISILLSILSLRLALEKEVQ